MAGQRPPCAAISFVFWYFSVAFGVLLALLGDNLFRQGQRFLSIFEKFAWIRVACMRLRLRACQPCVFAHVKPIFFLS